MVANVALLEMASPTVQTCSKYQGLIEAEPFIFMQGDLLTYYAVIQRYIPYYHVISSNIS